MNALYIKPKDSYAGRLLLSILVLFGLMVAVMYKIQHNDPMPQHNGFVLTAPTNQTLYILSSKSSALLYAKSGVSPEQYAEKLKRFSKFLQDIGYKTKIIPETKIDTLPKEAILFAVDTPAMSAKTEKRLKNFLKEGGNLFFNFTAGYSDDKGVYRGDHFVREITGLKLSPKHGFISFKGDGALFATTKMVSPFSRYLARGESMTIVLYDKLPFYLHDADNSPDIFATSFSQATPPISKQWKESITPEESGLGWHGYYGKGKWVYLSFPAYSLYDNPEDLDKLKKLTAGIVEFLAQKAVTIAYPFIDLKDGVFISEDTEYKFTNFQRFADLAKEYRLPVTAFIVASLADKPEHREMVRHIAKNPYVEFASHSTSHQQIVGKDADYVKNETWGSKTILDKYAPKPVRGFRPPREELNDLMKKYLAEGGFAYILGATEEFLYPELDKKYPRLLYIPRHGTDDYSYLVNLDWTQQQIVDQIISETQFVNRLNGIYTLSVHTHLFSYGTNINILRKYFHYLSQHPELHPLSGRQLYNRVVLRNGLHQSSMLKGDQLVITVTNDNAVPVKNMHIRLFKSPLLHILKGGVDDASVKVTLKEHQNLIQLNTVPPHKTIRIYLTLGAKG